MNRGWPRVDSALPTHLDLRPTRLRTPTRNSAYMPTEDVLLIDDSEDELAMLPTAPRTTGRATIGGAYSQP
jgi:hypothetical protein